MRDSSGSPGGRKKICTQFLRVQSMDDFFLTKAGDAFDGGSEVVVGSVFGCSDDGHSR